MRVRLALFLSSISVLAIIHIVANEFYLYWVYSWFDIPMHMLGGVCVALGISILPFFNIHLPERFGILKGYLLLVFAAGILWEVFQVAYGVAYGIPLISKEDFVWDTTVDVILDLAGGAIGYYLATRVKDF